LIGYTAVGYKNANSMAIYNFPWFIYREAEVATTIVEWSALNGSPMVLRLLSN
jgi:hypothetical protein